MEHYAEHDNYPLTLRLAIEIIYPNMFILNQCSKTVVNTIFFKYTVLYGPHCSFTLICLGPAPVPHFI